MNQLTQRIAGTIEATFIKVLSVWWGYCFCNRVCPHVNGRQSQSFPFHDLRGLTAEVNRLKSEVKLGLDRVQTKADRIGTAAGNSYQYFIYKKLILLIRRYERVLDQKQPPTYVDPRCIARQAPSA